MVVHTDKKDFYRRGCNDGTSFVLALVLLCTVVALVLINYLSAWPIYTPVLCLVMAVINMIVFSASPLARFQNERSLVIFMVAHGVCLLAVIIFLSLLVTQTPLFLSDDCNNCSLDWLVKSDEICGRAMAECRGPGKYRFGVFVLFPLGAGCLIMEIVNLISALVAWIHLKRKVK